MRDKISKTDAEWRAQLSDMAYKVTRKGKTERPFSHENFPESDGNFTCVCCRALLFDAETKFDSRSGWPSFYQAIDPESVGEKSDNTLFMRRTEVVCTTCDAHLGHVFPDGPMPTGKRYCINGAALNFEAKRDD